jgi:hypothetical protein
MARSAQLQTTITNLHVALTNVRETKWPILSVLAIKPIALLASALTHAG